MKMKIDIPEKTIVSGRKNRYRLHGGKRWIEVRIKSALQLFDARDPAPFRERDLDDDFVEYIVTSAREFSHKTALKIVIYIDSVETTDLSNNSIREAIQSFLYYQIDLIQSDLKTYIRRSQLFLLIGLAMLVTCISIAQNLEVPNPPGAIGVLREGVVIFGWVSIWKPIELILFDWYPLYEKLKFYKKILATEIDIQFAKNE